MQRSFLWLLVVSFVFVSCSQKEDEREHTTTDKAVSAEPARASSYTCPMHSDVVSNEPGTCPKCGMNLEQQQATEGMAAGGQELTANEKIKQAKKLLATAKDEMARDGSYKCCVDIPCNQCALDHQSCPCYNDLKKGKPVCLECYGGWQRGEGKDKNIDPKKVKTTFSDHKH